MQLFGPLPEHTTAQHVNYTTRVQHDALSAAAGRARRYHVILALLPAAVCVTRRNCGAGRTSEEGAGDDASDAVLQRVWVLVEEGVREVAVGGGQRQCLARVRGTHRVSRAVLRSPWQRP